MTREEAKNWLHKLYARADITDEYGDMEDMQPYEEALDMAISALSENKGEWIKDEKMSIVFDIYRCSRCSADGEPRYKFCPNCGAMMKGSEE